MLIFCSNAIGQTQKQLVQTVYLEKLANYIDWPKNNSESKATFHLAIVDNPQLCQTVIDVFSNRKIKGRNVEVRCIRNLDEVKNIDMLFLSSSKLKDLETVMLKCNGKAVLIVTEGDGFAKHGAHVNFYITEEQTLHFEMNKTSLDRDDFNVDNLLLDFAKLIK